MQTTIGRKLIRRNRAREEAYRDRLGALRRDRRRGTAAACASRSSKTRADARAPRDGRSRSIPRRCASPTTSTSRSPAASTGSTSTRSASFGESRVALPELLAAAEAKRSLLRLSDGSYGIVPPRGRTRSRRCSTSASAKAMRVRFRAAQALLIDALLQTQTDDARRRVRRAAPATSPTRAPEPRQEPPTLQAELRPYQRAGLGWLHFLRTTASAAVSRTTWASARPCRRWRCSKALRAKRKRAGRRSSSRRARCSSTGPRRRSDSRRSCACSSITAPSAREERVRRLRRRADDLRDDAPRRRAARGDRVRIRHPRRGAGDQERVEPGRRRRAACCARRHRLALSGTPIENHLGELWSLFEFLNPGLLGIARARSRARSPRRPRRRSAARRSPRAAAAHPPPHEGAGRARAARARSSRRSTASSKGKQQKLYDELRDHYRAVAPRPQVQKGGIEKSRDADPRGAAALAPGRVPSRPHRSANATRRARRSSC